MTKNYRTGVGVVLFNSDDKVFMGERIDNPGAWQFPQGGIDENEDPLAAGLRELAEETGIAADKVEVIRVLDGWLTYDLPQEVLDKLPWGKDYQGQKQKWIALRFLGDESDINLVAHEPPEFQNWEWVTLEEAPNRIVEFKRDLYNTLISNLNL